MLRYGQTKRGRGVGSAPLRGGASVRPWGIAGDGGPRARGDRRCRASVVPDLAGGRQGGPEGGRPVGAQADAGPGATGPAGYGPAPWPVGPWVPDRSLDVAPDRHGARAVHRGPAPSGARVATPAEVELVAPTAGSASPRTRRAGNSAVDARAVAAGKKTPAPGTPGSSSRTKAGFRNSPWSAGPGRPGAKRPS
jgi:hypothetical protein